MIARRQVCTARQPWVSQEGVYYKINELHHHMSETFAIFA